MSTLPRPLSKEELQRLRETLPPNETRAWYELIRAAWQDVDENTLCLDCGRKFKNLRGLRIHLNRSPQCQSFRDLDLHAYFLAKRLGVIEERR